MAKHQSTDGTKSKQSENDGGGSEVKEGRSLLYCQNHNSSWGIFVS